MDEEFLAELLPKAAAGHAREKKEEKTEETKIVVSSSGDESGCGHSRLGRPKNCPIAAENVRLAFIELSEYDAMTAPRLQRIHEILMLGLDDEHAGKLRTSTVRVGSVVFCPPEEVPDEWWTFWAIFPHVLRRDDLSPFGKAAWAVRGLLSLHPFRDGNGRCARLLGDWVLRQCGIPFWVPFMDKPCDRRRFVNSIKHAESHDGASVMLARHFLRCTWGTWQAYELHKRQKTDIEQIRTQAVVADRKETRQGPCTICFDDDPLVRLTCCGKGFHITCLMKALTKRSECPHCKEDMQQFLNADPELNYDLTKRRYHEQEPYRRYADNYDSGADNYTDNWRRGPDELRGGYWNYADYGDNYSSEHEGRFQRSEGDYQSHSEETWDTTTVHEEDTTTSLNSDNEEAARRPWE